jgi:rhamnose utilization protein RhaD (predicted bifunctional aldolase and dehydrogenase)
MEKLTREHLDRLAELSAQLGSDPLLVQAASGNTSVKIGDTLWIKSSGTWLAHALRDEIFVGVRLDAMRMAVGMDQEPEPFLVEGRGRASVETAMHSVLPEPVVVHVHSVNAIAWAVRIDGPAEVSKRLAGIDWYWIPYVPSGLPLARAVREAVRQAPRTRVFLLANHGLVVTGNDCDSTRSLLSEVESRLSITPRRAPQPDVPALMRAADQDGWRVDSGSRAHVLATDAVSLRIITAGVLFPCQAIFLAANMPVIARDSRVAAALHELEECGQCAPRFLLVDGAGVVVGPRFNRTENEVLEGLAEVVLRVPDPHRVRYLSHDEIVGLLSADVYRYRGLVESNESRMIEARLG